MSADEEHIIFTGGSAEEAEDFIFAIKKRAYSKGKSKDNNWITEFVSICFAKKALRWDESLDQETRNDWELLKRAILDEYKEVSISSSLVPTPASSNQISVLQTVPAAGPSIRTGRIRVASGSDTLKGYVSNTFVDGNWCTVSSSQSTAAIFEFDQSGRSVKFQANYGSEDRLILKSSSSNWAPRKGVYEHAALLKNIGRTISMGSGWLGDVQVDVWSIGTGSELIARWLLKTGGLLELEGVGSMRDKRIYITPDCQEFLKANGTSLFAPLYLHFEGLA
ncbi:hypothetical protein M407DRAFT_22464 [Tulasnella calospora MUT 4182]|uniref:Uncharacterized protein n=1 Tax=Tulasnella calospora MUT 4182 TaxID=1051891 RepID=A0A0C3L3V4_9AGAM|nr:hypothetical protein M407DRAFT_22464 [Tulasnella calospora MUT 4182]